MRGSPTDLWLFSAFALLTSPALADSVGRLPDASSSAPGAAPTASPQAGPPRDVPTPSSATPSPSTPPPLPSLPASATGHRPLTGAGALLERAAGLDGQGRVIEALGAYTECLRLDGSFAPCLLGLGRLRARLGDAREAETLFTAAARHPDFEAPALTERARLRRAQGREDEAVRDLSRAASLGADDPQRTGELSEWYVAHRAWPAALALWRRLLAEREVPEASLARARVQAKALAVLSRELDPVQAGGDSRSWTRRALSRLRDR